MLFEDLPIYCKIKILIECDHLSFVFLCRVNKELSNLFHGKLNEEHDNHNNLKERLFKERSLKYFSKYLGYKNIERTITWRGFYSRMIKWKYYGDNMNYLKENIKKNKFMEVVMYMNYYFKYPPDLSRFYLQCYINLACRSGHLIIVKYFYFKYDVLPSEESINSSSKTICDWFYCRVSLKNNIIQILQNDMSP